jgi:hypothetical protein
VYFASPDETIEYARLHEIMRWIVFVISSTADDMPAPLVSAPGASTGSRRERWFALTPWYWPRFRL